MAKPGPKFETTYMPSNTRFYVPPTLKSDYENLLDTEIREFTHTFE